MKTFFKSILTATLGGGIALLGYFAFSPSKTLPVVRDQNPVINAAPVSIPTDLNGNVLDFQFAANQSLNSVVHINTETKRRQLTQEEQLYELFYGNGGSNRSQRGSGSGVIISEDGFIVTNNHVVDNADIIRVILNDNREYAAKVIGKDPATDMAVIKIEETNLPPIAIGNSDEINVGEWVLAVGNPFNLTSTVTAGIVSAKGRSINIMQRNSGKNIFPIESFIQTDAAVNPGNSGGALVNTRGELIGINTAISSRTGSFIGYSFAVPSNITKKVIDDLLEFGNVQEAVLGIRFSPQENDAVLGVKITDIEAGQGAANAGLKKEDIIVKIGEVKITKFADLRGQLSAKRPGDFVEITVNRNGQYLTKKVKLGKKMPQFISSSFNWELKDVSKEEQKRLNISGGAKIYETIDRGDENNLNSYIITKINDKMVANAEEGLKLLESIANSRSYIIIELINLKGEKETIRFR